MSISSNLTPRVTVTLALGVFLLMALAACPGPKAESGTCESYFHALIAHSERCDGHEVASSRDRFEIICTNALAAPGAANLGSQFASCTQKLATASCGAEDTCADNTGTLSDGAPCAEGYQCTSGSCKLAPDSACGTCAPRIAIGGDCTKGVRCVEGAGCLSVNPATATCVAIRMLGAGGDCGSAKADEIVQCDTGLICAVDQKTRECRAPGKAGDACTYRTECSGGFYCVAGKCTSGSADLPEGARCLIGVCKPGLGCDLYNTLECQKKVAGKAGDACDDTLRTCERGVCDGIEYTDTGVNPGKCVDPLPDGATCSKDEGPPCDFFAKCIGGKCTTADPSLCK